MDWISIAPHKLGQVQWLWLMVGLQLLLFGLGWAGASTVATEDGRHMRGLAIFNVGVGFGLLLVGLRGQWPYLVTHAVSNVCSMLSFSVLWWAALSMTGVRQRWREHVALAALSTVLLLWFGQSPDTSQSRVSVYYLTVSWIALRGSWQVCVRLWADGLRRTGVILLCTGWLLGAMFVMRGVTGLTSTTSAELTFDTTSTHLLAYVILASGFIVNLVFANIVFGRLVRQLRRLSRRDMLTGLYNRRAIVDALQLEWERYRRGGPAFSVACVDIDLFKQVNDELGHAAGDEALVQVAQRLSAHIRPGDIIGRSGGEEFWVLLMCTELELALSTAERLREAVGTGLLWADRPARRLTVSIGVATASPADTSFDALVARADAALYRAKKSGRNRVRADPDSGLAMVANH